MQLPVIEDYRSIFLNDTPLLDVRAPVEFQRGAFPHAHNLPLTTDEEREAVGICYKQQGREKALELGHELVGGDIRDTRIQAWSQFVKTNPQGMLYCFRGGLRSQITQQWIFENSGLVIPRIKGGYKALRQYLSQELESLGEAMSFLVLSGRTGSGKTLLLQKLTHKLDLEGLFNHRGSAFGKHIAEQPSQINIENSMAIELLKLQQMQVNNILLEDETANIGSRRIPLNFFNKMRSSPLIILETDIDVRIDNVFNEYVILSLSQYQNAKGTDIGFDAWANNLREALKKIERRLGGMRLQQIKVIMEDAFQRHLKENNLFAHREWIRALLVHYYDPMYDYQLEKKQDRVILRGDVADVMNFLQERDIR